MTSSLSDDSLTLKRCAKCKAEKTTDGFYPKDSKCKPCRCELVRANRRNNIEHYRAFDKARYRTPERRAYTHNMAYSYVLSHPKARAAHTAVGNAVRDRRLFKKPCEACGNARAHAHHDDYDKPLDVRWLCPPCHFDWHQKNGPGLNIG